MGLIRILCSAALVAPTLSAAQSPPIPDWPVEAGSRVRISSPVLGRRIQTGSVLSATSDTLVFLAAKQSVSTAIGTPKILGMDVARGTHTTKLRGALSGLLVGAGSGALLGAVTYKRPKCDAPSGEWCIDLFGQGGSTALGATLGGVLGTFTGLAIGSRPTENWVPVAVPGR
jgi:hypothetical protein